MSRRVPPILLVVSSLLAPAAARADDLAMAQSLFDEAKRLMTEGRVAEACTKFEESQKIDTGLGTQFHLADCWQHLGRTAGAYSLFRDVESHARALGQVGRERVARARAEGLEPWLSKIVVAPHSAAMIPALEIRLDGMALGRERWDVPIPVDPGMHEVTVIAPNKEPWRTEIEMHSDGKTTTIDVPLFADVPDRSSVGQTKPARVPAETACIPPVDRATGVTSSMPTSAAETPIMEDRGSTQRAIGWFLVGAGVVGLGAGVYFGAQWLDARAGADPHCVRGGACDQVGTTFRNQARTQGGYAEASLGGGAAMLFVGAIVAASAPHPRVVMNAANLEITPVVGPRQGGLGLRGTW